MRGGDFNFTRAFLDLAPWPAWPLQMARLAGDRMTQPTGLTVTGRLWLRLARLARLKITLR